MMSKRIKFQLTDPEYRSDPFTAFGRLRELGPVIPARIMMVGNVWLATSYDAVQAVLKDDRSFCRDPANAGKKNAYFWFRLMLPGTFRRLAESMIGKDEPDHRRLRSLVDDAFQRQRITDQRPWIESMVDEQLNRVADAAKANGGEVDLMEHLARPVPLAVICELLGFPEEDRQNFRHWFRSFAEVRSFWSVLRVLPGLKRTIAYVRKEIERVRQAPRPGLITALVEAERSGDRLSDDELESMVMLLLLAGHETTVHLLSNSILSLLQLPHIRAELETDWSKVPLAAEEVLRYCSPAQFAKPRFVTKDMELYGVELKRGESIMPILASANGDPDRFERPREFLIERKKNYHVGFGSGPHVCVALKLALAETEIVLQKLFSRWPKLQPAFDPQQPDWSKRIGMRAVETLRVRLN